MKRLHIFGFYFLSAFTALFILSLPFGYCMLPDIGQYSAPFFEGLVKITGDRVLKIAAPYTSALVSDSSGMYIHLLLLLLSSALFGLTGCLFRKKEISSRQKQLLQVAMAYYLALQLLKYGCDKLFKHQFYLPEPNTVYTSLGDLSPDILYWSTMGTSYAYVVFCGLIEIIPALLLLFRRSRNLGTLLAVPVLLHVVVINFCFDISVKIYSCFLLLLAVCIAVPAFQQLKPVLLQKAKPESTAAMPVPEAGKKRRLYLPVKTLLILLFLTEALFPYLKSGNFNDDRAKRPFLQGAYEVELHIVGKDTLLPLQTDTRRWQRIFIHRRGYFIIQHMKGEMNDYELRNDSLRKQLVLTAYDSSAVVLDYRFTPNDSLLRLKGHIHQEGIEIRARQLNMKKLPLFQQGFHWTIDDYD